MGGRRASSIVFLCFFILGLFLICDAASTSSLKEDTAGQAFGWKLVTRTPVADQMVNLQIALKQRNLDKLEELFWQVSDPTSELYGEFLTVPQITELISPSAEDIKRVVSWIEGEALASGEANHRYELSVNRDYIFLSVPVSFAEQLFRINLWQFEQLPQHEQHAQQREKVYIYRSVAEGFYLPAEVSSVVDAIFGLLDFPPPARRGTIASSKIAEPGSDVTPQVIKSLYKIGSTMGQSPRSSQAVAEFEQAYFYPSDLLAFERQYLLPTRPIDKIIGPNHPNTGYLGEATLDVEYIIGVGTNISSWVFSIGTPGLDLISWSNLVMNTSGAPLIHSISWGSGESGYNQTLMRKINTEFQKLGTLGMSVFIASGDDGTGNTGYFDCGTFDPNFPASTPYATAVGGTYLNGGEIAWGSSGGGFSTVFPRPSYQNAAVNNYLQNGPNMPATYYFNPNGRAFPDVSALSTNFQIVTTNVTGSISGTSAATPTFAAVVSLLNDARYQVGKKPLGFINPWLYQLGKVGNDIVQGNNKVYWCEQGFSATTGWDAVTGWGTPDFPFLLKAALALK